MRELDSELNRDFIIWLREKFRRMKLNIKANTIDELKDALPMFETRIMKAFEKAKLEGKLEGKLEASRNLLDVLDVNTIAEKIGLTIEEFKKLKAPKNAAKYW